MKAACIVFTIIFSQAVMALKPLSDIERSILIEAEKSISKMSAETQKMEVEINKAQSICQTKCSICFDGVDCDFECVKNVCLDDHGEAK